MPLFASPESARAFAQSLRTQSIGKVFDFRERTASTNDLAMEAARAGAVHGATFVADVQDSGRGRRGRQWQSPAGLGLLFSVLTRPNLSAAADAGWIPLLAGLACLDGIRDATGLQLALKWPNDLVLPDPSPPGWRKLGGILCESVLPAGSPLKNVHQIRNFVETPGSRGVSTHCPSEFQRAASSAGGHGAFVVVGIGINVNHSPAELPPKTKAPPSSLRIELRRTVERTEVLRAVLEQFEERLRELEQPATRRVLQERIGARLREWWTPETALAVRPGSEEDGGEIMLDGRFERLDEFGRLVLNGKNGSTVLADAEVIGVAAGA